MENKKSTEKKEKISFRLQWGTGPWIWVTPSKEQIKEFGS